MSSQNVGVNTAGVSWRPVGVFMGADPSVSHLCLDFAFGVAPLWHDTTTGLLSSHVAGLDMVSHTGLSGTQWGNPVAFFQSFWVNQRVYSLSEGKF